MKEYKPLVVLLIISISLIAIGFFVTNNSAIEIQDQYLFWGDIIKNTGLTVLTVVIIAFLWNLLGGDPVDKSITELKNTLSKLQDSVKLLEDSKESGLERIIAISGEFGSHTDWMKRLKSATKCIDLMGYDLLVWTKGESFENEIRHLISKGVRIRVLLMDDNNHDLSAFMNTKQIRSITIIGVQENIKIVKSVFAEIKTTISQSSAELLEIRTLKNGLIPMQICRTDNRMTMVQYIFSEVASRSPMLSINGEDSSLFKIYSNEFEKLWELSFES